ncbi:epoxide hydrolase 2 [Magnaporthiopsis poae ATCC 64411]|uniref:Epoxide hydrolase 2 n=1 Tax=Magnaporthiopsis poae (strain ATCC 64411 / 73-15) TaxID=644358 RepID=A0A0C4DSV7_MAGP6|nr:epoxide hydrolase 2 [Magnaporthiopsis poae ATCC 64411]
MVRVSLFSAVAAASFIASASALVTPARDVAVSATAKLVPNDPRVESRNITVRGKHYKYLLGKPKGTQKGTILLIHGFPDLSFGWRNQIPALQEAGYQVIAPDMLGYGGTDAPDAIEPYGLKTMSDDIVAILDKDFPQERQVVIGGHDWGGFFVWRFSEHHPDRVSGVFSVCTPYVPPAPQYVPLERYVQAIPNFRYQLQFAGDEVVSQTAKGGRAVVRQVLNAMYGGKPKPGSDGQLFNVSSGVPFGHIANLEKSDNISDQELDFYTDEMMRHGFRGPTNWYRTRKVNFDDDRVLFARGKDFKIPTPAMYIGASRDPALPEAMSNGMEKYFATPLKRGSVNATHWALIEAPQDVNKLILEFAAQVGSAPKAPAAAPKAKASL